MYTFFSPSLKKIGILLGLLIISIPFIGYDTGVRCITTPCPSYAYTTVWKYIFLSADNPYAAQGFDISWFRAGIGVVAWYLIISTVIYFLKPKIARSE
jgi:hypothetical protein